MRASLRAAVRVGLLGGVVFGVAATLAAAGLDPRLLREPQDLVVLSLYLVLAFAALTGLAALAGGLLAGWARRRGRRPGAGLPRNAGLAVALLASAYVGLWWRSHLTGSPLVGQAAALLVGSRALARAGPLRLARGGRGAVGARASCRTRASRAGACCRSSSGRRRSSPPWSPPARGSRPRPRRATRRTSPSCRRGCACACSRSTASSAGWREQLVARGELPALAALLASGARAALRAEPERVPAIVWTTIATGRGPEAHGIESAEARRVAGLRTPVRLDAGRSPFVSALGAATDLLRLTRAQPPSAALRSVKAFWNVASEKGLRVGVVNWWATWPADP